MSTVHAFARRLLDRCGVRARPAVNVDLLAHRLGVRVRELRSPPGELGRVAVRGDCVEVVLQAGMRHGRRRFVLCHELGHVVCADPGSGALPLRRALEFDEERFCDRLAEAILLPEPWLMARFSERPAGLVALFSCAQEAGVSVATAAVALSRNAGWTQTLLRLQRSGGQWRLLSTTGHLPVALASVRGGPALSRVLDDEVVQKGRVQHVRLPLIVAGGKVTLEAEAAADGNRAFVLVDLRGARQ